MASLKVEVDRLHSLADKLLLTLNESASLELKYQKLISETALLRLFYSLEAALMNMAFRLLTNASYVDGTKPTLITPAFRGMAAAESAVVAANAHGARYAKWTQLRDFERNLRPFMPMTEHLIVQRKLHDVVFDDMRKVRNHVAHGTRSTGRQFASVVSRIYGGNPRGISPAKLLLSTRPALVGPSSAAPTRVIEQYIRWSKLAVRVIAKA